MPEVTCGAPPQFLRYDADLFRSSVPEFRMSQRFRPARLLALSSTIALALGTTFVHAKVDVDIPFQEFTCPTACA